MKKIYQLVLTLGVAASLASCSRSNYAANQHAPAAVSLTQAPAWVAPEATASVTIPAATLGATPAKAPVETPVTQAHHAPKTTAISPAAKASTPKLAQRLLLNNLTKQLRKASARQQNTANVAKPAANVKTPLIVLLIGVLVILIGGLIGGVNVVAGIGGAIFIVGLIMLIIALVRG